MSTVYLIRHGETAWNDPEHERIRGWQDVPLNAAGMKQAMHAAARLNGKGVRHIFTSDLLRAKTTADIISRHIGPVKITADKRLRPWNTGQITGRPRHEAEGLLAHFLRNPAQKIPAGESFNAFRRRWEAAFNTIKAKPGPVAIVTSHSNLLTLSSFNGKPSPKNVTRGFPGPGDIVTWKGTTA